MLTIFTPTYNRSNCLRRLAESLEKQTCWDFEWLIIDDGSTDDTREVVEIFAERLPIRYFFQKNSGKHIAYNNAIRQCRGDWFLCVDDDDFLTPDAVGVCCGMTGDTAGLLMPRNQAGVDDRHRWKAIDGQVLRIMDLKWKYGITESAILFRTSLLKKHRFPVLSDPLGNQERYCSEELLYYDLDEEGRFRVLDRCIYVAEYQPTGLTNQLFRLWMNNPNGACRMLLKRYEYVSRYSGWRKLSLQCRTILNWNALHQALCLPAISGSPSPGLSALLWFPGLAFRLYRFPWKGKEK